MSSSYLYDSFSIILSEATSNVILKSIESWSLILCIFSARVFFPPILLSELASRNIAESYNWSPTSLIPNLKWYFTSGITVTVAFNNFVNPSYWKVNGNSSTMLNCFFSVSMNPIQ